MRQVPLAEVKDDLSRYLRLAEREEIVITRHGRPAGVLIGFASEDDWFEYRCAVGGCLSGRALPQSRPTPSASATRLM